MTNKEKLEKIRSEVIWYIRLRNEGLIIGSCGDFEKLLKFIDSMQEEPKKCMYTKDNYTDNDRKVLCDGCEEECEHAQNQESVSEDLDSFAIKYAQDKPYSVTVCQAVKAGANYVLEEIEKVIRSNSTCEKAIFELGKLVIQLKK